MSLITPSGNSMIDWSPRHEEKMVRVAGKGQKSAPVKTDRDLLYEAARNALKKRAQEEPIVEDEPIGNLGNDTSMVDEVSDGADLEVDVDVADNAIDEVDVEIDEETGDVEVSAALEEAASALENAQSAVGRALDAVEVDVDVVDEDEVVEIDFDETTPETDKDNVDVDVNIDAVPGEEDDTLMVESEEDMVTARTANDFVKISKLSPENRKKIYNFWVNELNYPKDYVKLMVTDYEK